MARIKLKNNEVLNITNEEAQRVSEMMLGETPASVIPVTHAEGTWVGSRFEITQILLENSGAKPTAFESIPAFINFHVKYGKHKEYYLKGYGYVDMSTNYRVAMGLIRLEDNGFSVEAVDTTPHGVNLKLITGLWLMYLSNLDSKGVLKQQITIDGIKYFNKHELREFAGTKSS